MDNLQCFQDRTALEGLVTQQPSETEKQVKTLKLVCNHLIATIQEANDQLLTVCASIDEPDKVLGISKLLSSSIAQIAKV
jgi:hypothetical protein